MHAILLLEIPIVNKKVIRMLATLILSLYTLVHFCYCHHHRVDCREFTRQKLNCWFGVEGGMESEWWNKDCSLIVKINTIIYYSMDEISCLKHLTILLPKKSSLELRKI